MVQRIAGQMGPEYQIVFHVNCSSTLDIPQSTFNTNTNTINHATGNMLPRCDKIQSSASPATGQRARRDLTNFQHFDISLRCHSHASEGCQGSFAYMGPCHCPLSDQKKHHLPEGQFAEQDWMKMHDVNNFLEV
ncbi:Uncharacterized protein Adt_04329 [Abeliophyllum distichum]|uniref:Uncharacterized protein n=1 Tax=Abeliophyllum distichum TaxID=126358 RepID=A0ABD1W1H0_9LAMI